jgi:hypothetical protein
MSSESEIVELPAIETLGLKAQNGPETSAAAFIELEDIIPLRGRKFYGVYDLNDGAYHVGTKLQDGDEQYRRSLEPYTIPGGKYAYRKLAGEHDELITQIPGVLEELIGKYAVDKARPWIEYYRRLDEFRLYLPIK